MATIAQLIIAMGADPSGLRRGLNQGINEIRQFARSAAAIGSRSNIFGDLNTPAKRAAESAVKTLRSTLAIRMADARENLALGIFNEKQFRAEAQAAAVAFNTGLRSELARLSSGPGFTSQIHAGLVSQFITIGDDSGQAFARGFSRVTQLTRSLGLATRRIGTELTAAVTIPIVAAGAAAIKFGRDFGRSMANVASLVPGNREAIKGLENTVLSLSRETGQQTGDIAQGLYQVVSAFGIAADTAEKLGVNARAAVGGLSTVTEAVNVTSAVTKAYGDTTLAATQRVADLALKTVQLGQTTFPELAASIGRVSPLAANLGVTMEELFATMATGSGVTGDASEVATQFRGILQALQAPTETLAALFAQLGVSSGKSAIEQRGLVNVIKSIVESAQASGRPLQDYIQQIEGQTLALSLAGQQADTYVSKLHEMQNATGSVNAAFKEQTEGVGATGHALDTVARDFEEIAIRLGQSLGPALLKSLPAIESLGNTILSLVNKFGALDPATQEFLLTLTALAAAFGPFIHVLGTVITTLAAVARTLFLARTAGIGFGVVLGVITSPVTITIAAITAIIGVLFLFRKELASASGVILSWIAGLADSARRIPLVGRAIASVIELLAGKEAIVAARDAGQRVGEQYNKSLAKEVAQPVKPTVAAPQLPAVLRGAGLQAPKPIVLIDPKELNAQVQTAVDRLNLAREAGQKITVPFRELIRLQDLLNTRLAQGKLTIDDENQLTRALLNARKAIGDAAGTSVDALSNRMQVAIETLQLAQQQSQDLAGPMRTVNDIIDLINTRLGTSVLRLQDQNTLTRDILAAQKALAEARKPDTRAFDAFAASARSALAQLQALKGATDLDVKVPTSDAGEQLDRLLSTQFLINGAAQQYRDTLVDVRSAYANILGEIASTVAPTKEQLDLAKQLGEALKEAARAAALKSAPVSIRNLLSQLQLAAASYADAQAALILAKEASDKSAANAAKKTTDQLQQQAIKLQQQIASLVRSGALSPTEGLAVLERMRELMKAMGVDTSVLDNNTHKWIRTLGRVAQSFAGVLQGVEGILDAMGALDDSTRKVVEGLTKVAQNAPAASQGDPGAILGVIGGVIQTISGLFGGKSPEEKERDRIDRDNHNVLLRIARGIDIMNQISLSGQQFAKLSEIFSKVATPGFLEGPKLGNRVDALLKANGFDIEDVKKAAQELGLTFQNTAQFYRDFNNALKTADITNFTNTFTGQLDKLNRSFQIFNITDPVEKLKRTIALLTDPKVGSPAIQRALEGVDLSTAQGIQDFQKRIQDLFDNFQALTPEDLGGLTASQFLDALATAAGLSQEALDKLTNSIGEATHEMLNVPTGFRQARAEFLAQQQAQLKPVTPEGPLLVGSLGQTVQDLIKSAQQPIPATTAVTDRLDQIRDILSGREPAKPEAARDKQAQVIYQFTLQPGSISIASDGRPGRTQADDFLKQLRLKASATTGDSNRIGDV